jgi:MATE family multidrug resistance protein
MFWTMSQSYKLTRYKVGSKREFWSLTWPLMLGMMSTTIMMFVDRLFLAQFDPQALNAAASAGMAYLVFLVIPIAIASVSEVLVGRLHGRGRLKDVGAAAWQMVWFGVFLAPIFWIIACFFPNLLFAGTGNEFHETRFFLTLMLFAPVQCIMIAIAGFFIGIGRVQVVTMTAVIGNIINIVLDYFLIFGSGAFLGWGVIGAALSTGIAQIAQVAFLFFLFLRKKNRIIYQTQKFGINYKYLMKGLKIGVPLGLGHSVETIAHFLFFRIVISVGFAQMTVVTIVQSLYILISFIIDAQSKGAAAIVANLLGAEKKELVKGVLKSSFMLHFYYFLGLAIVIWFFADDLLLMFINAQHRQALITPEFMNTFVIALLFMGFYFLFDGWAWILMGFLTASGDTKFVLFVSLVVQWLAYVVPTFFLIGIKQQGADIAWSIITFMSFLSFVSYFWRYYTGRWLRGF